MPGKPCLVYWALKFITCRLYSCALYVSSLSYLTHIIHVLLFQPHKYIIQAVVLRNSWPLSESQWVFVQGLKELEKAEIKGIHSLLCITCVGP